MKIWKLLSKGLRKDSSIICYQSIDELPLLNWFKLNDGELKYILKDDSDFDEHICTQAWESLYDEYLSRFGAGTNYERYLKTNIELINTRLDFVIKRDRKILNKIDRLEARISNMLISNGEPQTPQQILYYLSKEAGFKYSLTKTTVSEYFTAIAEYDKKARELEKKSKNGKKV